MSSCITNLQLVCRLERQNAIPLQSYFVHSGNNTTTIKKSLASVWLLDCGFFLNTAQSILNKTCAIKPELGTVKSRTFYNVKIRKR